VSVGAVYDYSGLYANSDSDCPYLDEAEPDRVACFSQTASILSLFAPGARISAAGLTKSGTSMAAPHVAGAAAVLWQALPGASHTRVADALVNTGPVISDHRGGPAKRRLDLCAALRALLLRAVCSTAGDSGSDLVFSAGTGQSNVLTVSLSGADYTIADAGAAIAPDPGCTRVTISKVTCPAGAISRLVISTGDGDDRVGVTAPTPAVINGGDGADYLLGGPRNDRLNGGLDADQLGGRDGHDTLDGGPGSAPAETAPTTRPTSTRR
jgi:subtilisin family serine protease